MWSRQANAQVKQPCGDQVARQVLEPLRRPGVAPAKHGTSQPTRQAARAVLGAVGGPHRIWYISRQLDALERCDRIAPEGAHQCSSSLDRYMEKELLHVAIAHAGAWRGSKRVQSGARKGCGKVFRGQPSCSLRKLPLVSKYDRVHKKDAFDPSISRASWASGELPV